MDDIGTRVCRACLEKYDSLPKRGKPRTDLGEWNVLAAVCAVRGRRGDGGSDDISVVSLATGTKCLGLERLRSDGCTLGDTHAEVLARRSFRWYLVNQFETLLRCGRCEAFAYVEKESCEGPKEGSRIKPIKNVRYYMYISQSPCGDACILESSSDEESRLRKRRKKTCDGTWNLFTGAKAVLSDDKNGTRQLDGGCQRVGILRTKPGRGSESRSVSCSDKIARWTCLGFQGALLSLLTEPIYIDALVLPHFVYRESVRRAIVDRVFASERVTHDVDKSSGRTRATNVFCHCPPRIIVLDKTAPVFPGTPLHVRTHEVVTRETREDNTHRKRQRSSDCAIIWARGRSKCEVVLAKTGLRAGTTRKDGRADVVPRKCRSFVCSASSYEQFFDLCKQLVAFTRTASSQIEDMSPVQRASTIAKRFIQLKTDRGLAYSEAKSMNISYQHAKAHFKKGPFAIWPKKDPALYSFKLP